MENNKIYYDNWITLDTESNKDGSLYLISTYSKKEKARVFYDLESLFNYLDYLGNVIIYVHNYANWDSYFLNTAYTFKRYKYVSHLANQKKLLSLTIRSDKSYLKFEDSYPRTQISIKDYAMSIGREYEVLPDYSSYRVPGKPEKWKDRKLIENYAVKDVEILYDLIKTFKGIYEGFDKSLSAGSMVWSEVIQAYDTNHFYGYLDFRKEFVALDLETDAMIRSSYMGGITTPFWNNGIELNDQSLPELYSWFEQPTVYGEDISSAYAAAQVKPLPSGKFIYLYKEDIDLIKDSINDPSVVVFVNVKYSYDRAKFPLIPKMSMEEVTPYTITDDDEVDFEYNEKSRYMESMLMGGKGYASINTFDLRLALKENVYDNLRYEFNPYTNTDIYGIMFKTKVNEPLKKISMKYYKLKNQAKTKGLRTAYKSPLLNLYGKTGERMYTEDLKLDIVSREYINKVERDHPLVPKYSNVAVASMITMYVHHDLYFKAKEVGFKNILYCDTDSLYYVGDGRIPIQAEEELGSWQVECFRPKRSIFISPKRYIIEDFIDDKNRLIKRKTASAGISKEDSSFNIDNWNKGKRVFNTKVKVKITNGIYLTDSKRDVSDSFSEGDTFYYKDWATFE